MNMIDRIAAAIKETAECDLPPDSAPTLTNPHEVARAVLETLLKPTRGMVEAGSGIRSMRGAKIAPSDMNIKFAAAIRAALDGQ